MYAPVHLGVKGVLMIGDKYGFCERKEDG